jgi:hypothetical protein
MSIRRMGRTSSAGGWPGRFALLFLAVVLPFLAYGPLAAAPASASPVPTAVTLVSSVNPAVTGQGVTFTATVAEVPAGTIPTGSVQFTFNPPIAGVCQGGSDVQPLTTGVAQCATTLAASSNLMVTAQYQGSPTDGATASPPLSQVVDPGVTDVAVTSTAVTPPVTEAGCTTTATVATVSCPSLVGVTAGAAVTETAGSLPPGTTVVAVNRTTDVLTLSAPATATGADTLTFVDNPTSSYPDGHPGHFTATLSAVSPASGTPTGRITWTITAATGGTIACSNGTAVKVSRSGTATCTIPAGQLQVGGYPYSVTAAYSGDTNYGTAVASFSQPVLPSPSKTYVSGSPMPPLRSTSVSFTAAVVPARFAGPATGTVTFSFTLAPTSVLGCTLATTSTSVTCTGGTASVIAGDDVSDVTNSGALGSGTVVSAVHGSTLVLSAAPALALGGQTLLFTPTVIPPVTCAGGSDTVTLTLAGATCAIPSGLPFVGPPYALVASYSGDANVGASSTHTLAVKVR